MIEEYDVIVLGAGASGLMCAITAGNRGKKVLVLDRSNKIGKKILMSGGGRCNFTNYSIESENFICNNPHFVKSALNQYTQWDFISLVSSYQIPYHERDHGQLFCNDSAKDILNMLKAESEKANVRILDKCETESISFAEKYILKTSIGEFKSASIVVATGGLSIPSLGSSGFGFDIARQFNLDVIPVRAGLVPFTFSDWFKNHTDALSGIAIQVTVSVENKSFNESVLFTHRGLSGPAILQISNYWKQGQSISIDLLPNVDTNSWFTDMKQTKMKQTLKNVISMKLPKKLAYLLCDKYWPSESSKPFMEISDKQLSIISNVLHSFTLKPSGTEGYRTAEVTLGGVDTNSISSKTMECKTQPGLFFVGEVLDVSGHLGGYNFQWAWSSGYVSGLYC
jgi:predicted Rossmann fold flavoprotein